MSQNSLSMRSNKLTTMALRINGLPPMYTRFLYSCLSGNEAVDQIYNGRFVVDRQTESFSLLTTIKRESQRKIRNDLSIVKFLKEEKKKTKYGSEHSVLIFDEESINNIMSSVKSNLNFKDSPSVSNAASLLLPDHTAWLLLVWLHSIGSPIVKMPSLKTFRETIGVEKRTIQSTFDYLLEVGCLSALPNDRYGLVHYFVNPMFVLEENSENSFEEYVQRVPKQYSNQAMDIYKSQRYSIEKIKNTKRISLSRMDVDVNFITDEKCIPRKISRDLCAEYESMLCRLEKIMKSGVRKQDALASTKVPFCPVFCVMENSHNVDSVICRDAFKVLKNDSEKWEWVKSLYRAGDSRAIHLINVFVNRSLITSETDDGFRLIFSRCEMGDRKINVSPVSTKLIDNGYSAKVEFPSDSLFNVEN